MGIRLQLSAAHIVAHANFLSANAELGSQAFEIQVIGNLPEAEARLYLEQTMGTSVTDAEWAATFEVRVHACVEGRFLFCRLFIASAVWG